MDFHLDLHTETVERAHPAPALTVSPDQTVRAVICSMKEHNSSTAVVCEGGKLVGIFTERDALRLMARDADLDVLLRDVMTANPKTLTESDPVSLAITQMSKGGYRRLPVVDGDGCPKGVLTTRGILHYLVEHFPEVIYNLPPSPHHTTQQREGA